MSERAEGILQMVIERIRSATRRITFAELAAGIATFVALTAGMWVAATAAEAGLWLSSGARTVVLAIVATAVAGLAVRFVVLPAARHLGYFRPLDREDVARRIGRVHPEVSDRLVNLLQLARGKHSSASDDFLSAAVTSLGESVAPYDFNRVEDFARPKRVGRVAVVPVLILLAFVLAAPGPFFSASHRLISPGVEFVRPDAFAFIVEPGDAKVLRGEALMVAARTTGSREPAAIFLERRAEGEQQVERVPASIDSVLGHVVELSNIRHSFRYRLTGDGVSSRWYTVSVIDRPLIERLQVSLDFPRYSGIPRQTLGSGVGDVSALRGTLVSLSMTVGGAQVSRGRVVHGDGTTDSIAVDGREGSGSFRVRRDGTYHIELESIDGIANESPIVYRVRALEDAVPSITLVSPEATHELDEGQPVDVIARISDDFGFNRASLFYRLAESRFGDVTEELSEIRIPIDNPRVLAQELVLAWQVGSGRYIPVPGDVFEYHVTVWDNDAVGGFKSASTRIQRLVVPSMADRIEELDRAEDEVQDALEDLVERASEVREQFDELKEELRQNPTPDWEDDRQLERLRQRQEEVEQSVEELTEQMKDIASEMQEQGLVSEETLQLFEDFQSVMEEINSEELDEALEALKDAMQNLDLQRMQEALENFDFQENQFQERLKRSLDLLKELRVKQGLDEVLEMAEELAERQEELQQRTQEVDEQQKQGSDEESTSGEREDIAAEQELSAEDMKALEERLEELTQQMQEVGRAPTKGMEQLSEEVQEQQLPEQMQQNAEQMRNNQLQPAQQGQQQMQQQLQGMQQQLGEMQAGMESAQMQLDVEGLRRALSDVLQLSEREEELRSQVDAAGGDGPRLRELARQQVTLSDGLRVVTDSLTNLSRRMPQMSSALQDLAAEGLRDMASATSSMSDRVPAQASGHQRSAMMQLNELALLLSDLLGSMNNQSSGAGSSMEQMMQQMQQMAGDQQRLNEQIQQLLNDMAGQRLTQDMQDRMRSLAGQQDAMRRQLKEMSRNPELRGKALGDLNRIAQQMEETVRELERRRAGRRTVERQQEILTRLLEATRSLQERGREEKRESRTGEDELRTSPDALEPDERLDALRRDLIRALEAGYSPDYEELIKRYFEELQGSATDG